MLWRIREALLGFQRLTQLQRERPLTGDEREERTRYGRQLRGFRGAATNQVSRFGADPNTPWISILLERWDGKDDTLPVGLSSWGLEEVEKPSSFALVPPEETDYLSTKSRAYTPAYNVDLFREAQRIFGKESHPVLEQMRLGYDRVTNPDGEHVPTPPQVRQKALAEVTKYFYPQMKQIETKTEITKRTGVMVVSERLDPEAWSRMVADHVGVIAQANQRLKAVAAGGVVEAEVVEITRETEDEAAMQEERRREAEAAMKQKVVLPATAQSLPKKPATIEVPAHEEPDPGAEPAPKIQKTRPPHNFDRLASKTPPRTPPRRPGRPKKNET